LWLNNLFLSNFRNFKRVDLKFSPLINIFWGNNGEGKTNLLEALYCLGQGNSFRADSGDELIKWGEENVYLKGEGIRDNKVFVYELFLNDEGSHIRKVNSHRVNLKDTKQWLWMVIFSPQDLELIGGSPYQRRNFLDTELSYFNFRYPYLKLLYKRILGQRNFLLSLAKKKDIKKDLETWNEQLVDKGSQIVKMRLEGLKETESFFKEVYPRVAGKDLSVKLSYKSSFLNEPGPWICVKEIKEAFWRKLAETRKKEIERGITLAGPHRDDFVIFIKGVNLNLFGSRGEQRIAAFSLRLSEFFFVKSREGEEPIVLLDDITSELDPLRQKLLLNFIQNKTQIFITTTQPLLFKHLYSPEVNFYKIVEGEVRKERDGMG